LGEGVNQIIDGSRSVELSFIVFICSYTFTYFFNFCFTIFVAPTHLIENLFSVRQRYNIDPFDWKCVRCRTHIQHWHMWFHSINPFFQIVIGVNVSVSCLVYVSLSVLYSLQLCIIDIHCCLIELELSYIFLLILSFFF